MPFKASPCSIVLGGLSGATVQNHGASICFCFSGQQTSLQISLWLKKAWSLVQGGVFAREVTLLLQSQIADTKTPLFVADISRIGLSKNLKASRTRSKHLPSDPMACAMRISSSANSYRNLTLGTNSSDEPKLRLTVLEANSRPNSAKAGF